MLSSAYLAWTLRNEGDVADMGSTSYDAKCG